MRRLAFFSKQLLGGLEKNFLAGQGATFFDPPFDCAIWYNDANNRQGERVRPCFE